MPQRFRTPAALIALLCLPAALAGCGDRTLADRLGMGKRSPDEFAIVKRAPLVRPPDYELRPPRPGAPRPQEPTAPEAARAALTGMPVPATTPRAAGASPGQQALLAGAGAGAADPLIRDRLDAEGGAEGRVDNTLFGDLLGVNDGPLPGTVIDAAAEAERLRASQAAGLPPGGGEAPTLIRRGQSAL